MRYCIPDFKAKEFLKLKSSKELFSKILVNGFWMPDEYAENSEEFRHVASYTLIYNPERKAFLIYLRKNKESRLSHKWSIGIGGHYSQEDEMKGKDSEDAFRKNALREIHEETNIKTLDGDQLRFFMAIAIDNTKVDRAHFGLCWFLKTKKDVRMTKEIATDLWNGSSNQGWCTLDEFERLVNISGYPLESWTSYLLFQMRGKHDK